MKKLFVFLSLFCIVTISLTSCKKKEVQYQITFDVDGGEELAPITGVKGLDITLPKPVKEGFEFLGWYLDGQLYQSKKMPEKNITLVAKWEEIVPEPVLYTITFNCDGGSTVNNITKASGEAIVLPTPIKEGYKFLGWFKDNKVFTETKMPSQNITLVAKWEEIVPEPVLYTITFNCNGGSTVNNITKASGEAIVLPTPTKEGYKFLGWFKDNKVFTETVMPSQNITLVAKWEEIVPEPVLYTITFNCNGGSTVNNITQASGEAIVLPTPTKEGYKFLGWFKDNKVFTETVMPSQNITLVAKWEEIVPEPVLYTITFNCNGGSTVNNITKASGEAIVLPTPTKEGYKFLGWFKDNKVFTETKMPSQNITLVAKWEEIVKENINVTYVLNGGWLNYQDLNAIKTEFDKDYKQYTGQSSYSIWNNSESLVKVFTQTNKKWNWLLDYWAAVNTNSYSGKTNASQFLKVKDGQNPDEFYYLAVEITSWYNNSCLSVYGGSLKAANYAELAIQYQIYEYLSKSQNNTKAVIKNGDSLINEIYNIGYKFLGWYTTPDFKEGTKVTSLTNDATIYAKWEKVYHKLTYVVNNDAATVPSNNVQIHPSNSYELATPTYDQNKFRFLGWYLDEECTKKITKIDLLTTEDVTVYGAWKKVSENEFEVSYVLNDGNWLYSSYDEIIEDFLCDYNRVRNTSLSASDFFANVPNNAHLFFDEPDMFAKWKWLFSYFYGLGEEKIGFHSESQQQYQTFLAGKGSTVSVQWAIRQNIQGFLTKTKCAKYSNAAAIDFTVISTQDKLWTYLNNNQQTKFTYEKNTTLPTPHRCFYSFKGWYDNPSFTGTKITEISKDATLYAKWEEENPVSKIEITNDVTEVKNYSTLQLEWNIEPSNAQNKNVVFESLDTSVATVDEFGLVTFKSIGTVRIKITSTSASRTSDTITLSVYEPGHFNVSYQSTSYVAVDSEIKLLASYINKDQSEEPITWTSLTPEIASVNDGAVKGLKAGIARIKASTSKESFEFVVTVLPNNISSAMQHVINSHQSNVFTKYNLAIGYPKSNEGYYKDIFGSVSKLLYNHTLEIDDTYLSLGNANDSHYTNSIKNTGLEFITVHYTGTFGTTADTDNIARNFTRSDSDVSIHYVTGNQGVYEGQPSSEVYHTLSHDHGAYHAGDSGSYTTSNYPGNFKWYATGVKYDNVNILDVQFSASNDFYYEINGKKTKIKLPNTWNYNGRNTDYIYNSDGTISSKSGFNSPFTNRTPESFFNLQGLPITVINGEYYMGPTWWSYRQVYEGRICGVGGNRNSIGIESCVNIGSDLWYTWQVTAQLVAKLMNDNNLGIERVKGHHFFDGKDCPQPLLENDLEIWDMFIEMVQAEYELLTTYKDVSYSFATVEDYDFVSENGRIINQPEFSQVVEYKVTIEQNGKTEEIVLASIVEGIYNK